MPWIKDSELKTYKEAQQELAELKKEVGELDLDNLPSAEEVETLRTENETLKTEVQDLKAGKILNPTITKMTDAERKAKKEAIKKKFNIK